MATFSRRTFLQKSGAGIGGTLLAGAMPTFFTTDAPIPVDYDSKKLRVALCGLGNYAGTLAVGLASSSFCQLAGIVTGHPSKAAAWQKKYNIPSGNVYDYNNFDRIAGNKEIDLVYIVLPNGLHKEFVLRAAKAGKHVITEKPMATSEQECEDMIKACQDANVQLAVGYRLHYEPYNLEIKRLGQEKIFGPVRFIEASLGYRTYNLAKKEFGFPIDDLQNWRLQKKMAGGGPLLDLGVYCIQACRYVLGEEPVSVTAQYGPVHDSERFSQVEESMI